MDLKPGCLPLLPPYSLDISTGESTSQAGLLLFTRGGGVEPAIPTDVTGWDVGLAQLAGSCGQAGMMEMRSSSFLS